MTARLRNYAVGYGLAFIVLESGCRIYTSLMQ